MTHCVTVQGKFLVNEAHLFNDAGIMFDVQLPSQEDLQADGQCDAAESGYSCAAGTKDNTQSVQHSNSCNAVRLYNASISTLASEESDSAVWPVSTGLLLVQKVWNEVLATAATDIK